MLMFFRSGVVCILSVMGLMTMAPGLVAADVKSIAVYPESVKLTGADDAAQLIVTATQPDGRLVEISELRDHPFMVGSQFHPEFKSRPNRPHPLFRAFIGAAIAFGAQRRAALEQTPDQASRSATMLIR